LTVFDIVVAAVVVAFAVVAVVDPSTGAKRDAIAELDVGDEDLDRF
jgi:hypothetical protein